MNESAISVPKNFDVQGHRGCRGLMPENTIAAFIKAIDLGVTTLEMDVVITKDSEVLVSHEPFFNHEITTKPNGEFVTETEEKSLNIYEMNYAQTQQFDVGLKPHPRFKNQQKIKATKPSLKQVIDTVEKYIKQHNLKPVYYNIETKTQAVTDNIYHPAPEKFIDILMSVIDDKKINERVIIQSFDVRTIQYLHQKNATIKTAYLFEGITTETLEERIKKLAFKPTIYSPNYETLTQEMVKYCHANNIKVIPWTVNTVEKINKMITISVDGIITDYPNLFLPSKK